MIPPIIHYCWFGGNPLPQLARECIASWRKFLPGYEIKQWDESNFNVDSIPYTAEAYRQKKYAFVSDYARFWIMYYHGGIYFDTDVEVIRPLDNIIANGNFMGFEIDPDGKNTPGKYAPRYCFGVNPGLGFGMEQAHSLMKKMLNLYATLEFQPIPQDIAWYKTIVAYTTETLCKDGLRNKPGIQDVQGIKIYPSEYFAPINGITNRLHMTENTHTIHRYAGSWGNGNTGIKECIRHLVPEWVLMIHNNIKRGNYKIR